MCFFIVLLGHVEVKAAAAILRALPSSISLSSAEEIVFSWRWLCVLRFQL